MTRYLRILSTLAAPPPATVAMESDFVVILAALLCALICVVGLIAVARCACLRRRSGVGTDQNNRAALASANRGLKKKILQSLPKFTYTKDGGGSAKFVSVECAICLGEFVEGVEIKVLPHCGHGFHVRCIDTWLGSHSSCPSCRQILVVARCQKCGQFPAVSSGNASGSVTEAQMKAREDNNIPANRTNTFLP
ncbi:hypothetical protein SLEP1_g31811 [Rubroshorea leprosula]|uniref:RING-type domain-containing protein n=1 Tax=Rubroshorea leprosula TaxID=152421 RepID=A0AAV5KBC3_9ROSI|nr:hypothetical protein SLEP1_g31811 [Rubroshorea leprosula]